MEALSFMKFWRPIDTTQKENQNFGGNNVDAVGVPKLLVCAESEFDEGDDSFFELELTVSDFDNKKSSSSGNNNNHNKESNGFDSNNNEAQQQLLHYSTKNAGHGDLNRLSQQQTTTTLSMSSTDFLSKRKILPIVPSSSSSSSSKPHSPIALLKSAPKLRVSIFKKSKSMAAATLKTEKNDIPVPKREQNKRHFTFTFKLEEASKNRSVFTRASSLRKTHQQQLRDSITDDLPSSSSSSCDHSSKRFSRVVLQKYLKLIRPLYVKVSKKKYDKVGFSGELTEASSASSPANLPAYSPKKEKQGNVPSGFRVASRHLGKSKSASATAAAVLSPARRDDSLLLQHDGIESAILHCKKSFNSRDSSSLSRSTSCSSQETFSNLSSKDSSLLSRFSYSSTEEFISRKSNELGI